MFDFGLGTSELLLIAIVAIIVVGPKELPKLLRAIGTMMGKVRSLAREFQGHLEEAARDTGIDDIKNEVKKAADEASGSLAGENSLKQTFQEMGRDLEASLKDDTSPLSESSPGDRSVEPTKKADPAKTSEPAKDAKAKAARKAPAKKTPNKTPAKKAASKKPASKKSAGKKPVAKSTELS